VCFCSAELDLSFRLVTSSQGKPDALLDTLRHLRPGSATMVFTNTTKAAVFVTAMLREQVTLQPYYSITHAWS
jgi:superfamily II DNA/RNA helicase